MPRFSEAFLRQMTSPGLFGAGITQLGQDLKEANKLRQRRGMLEQFIAGTPEQRAQVLQQEAIRTGNLDMAVQGVNMANVAQQEAGNRIIQPLLTELSNPETSDERAKEIRAEIFDAARANPQLDEGNVRKAFNATNKARIMSGLEKLQAETSELSIRAEQALSANQTRDDFIRQHGEEAGYIYDAQRDAKELRENQLAISRENKRKSTYQYSDEVLKGEPFYFSDSEIAMVNAISGGENKNNRVHQIVEARSRPHNAALITVQAKALLNQVAADSKTWYGKTLELDDKDERPIIESEAYRRVLEAQRTGGLSGISNLISNAQDQEQELEPVDYGKIIEELAKKL